jgi:curved DNA-binding protein CbpA
MNDPYSVLGVTPSASDEEIKKAYRELVRKYHPDNYNNNPLADLAQEKMKEINEAYDQLTKNKNAGNGGGYGSSGYNNGGYSGYTSASGGSAEYNQVRAAINSGNLALAEQLLNGASNRNAEWHFLMGSVFYRKGWLDDAKRYFQKAAEMDPGNQEYIQALSYISRGQPYNPYGYDVNRNVGGCSFCDICSAMLCAEACCNC